MTSSAPAREPLFNVPPVVAVMLCVIVALQLALISLPEADETWFMLALAFIPDRYATGGLAWPGGALAAWMSPLTHMLVHGDWGHLLLNAASLLAFGSVVARRHGAVRFVMFAIFCGLAGALVFLAFNAGLQAPMIGASGAIAGMMAGTLRLLFSAIDSAPPGFAGDIVRNTPQRIALMNFTETLRDPRIRSATVVWLAINLLGAYGLGTPGQAGAIAWEAHIGGYFAGLLGLGLFGSCEVAAAADPLAAGTKAE